MFFDIFLKFFNRFGKKYKLQILTSVFLSFIAGLMEFFGIAVIFAFIALITTEGKEIPGAAFQIIKNYIHFDDFQTLSLILGILIVSIFVFKNIFMIILTRFQAEFLSKWMKDVSLEFMKNYILAPYQTTKKIPSSEKLYMLNHSIPSIFNIFVDKTLQLISITIICSLIFLYLLLKFTLPTIFTGIFLAILNAIQMVYLKKRSKKLGAQQLDLGRKNSEVLNTNFNAAKEIKIFGKENYFLNKYANTIEDVRKNASVINFQGAISQYITEIIIVFAIVLLSIFFASGNNSDNLFIASLGVVAAAVFRLTPLLNKMQNNLYSINSSKKTMLWILESDEKLTSSLKESINTQDNEKMPFNKEICLNNICYTYENKNVLKDFSLRIEKGGFVGIIGLSGAGKTTLVDVIMGINHPHGGSITVDSTLLTSKNLRKWQNNIANVPQEFYLSSETVLQNVAWGLDDKNINKEFVLQSLKDAMIYEEVKDFLEKDAKILTDNQGLSVGQKQRLAIARALYTQRDVLILDEATSSLDVEAEYEITKVLERLKGKKTIIAIAHRLSTLKMCERIIYLKEGKMIDSGTFQELSDKHPDFKSLLEHSGIKF